MLQESHPGLLPKTTAKGKSKTIAGS
jgi:hypothetical protein